MFGVTQFKQFLLERPSYKRLFQHVRSEAHLLSVRLANQMDLRKQRQLRSLEHQKDIKLHWGCGSRKLNGWINVDGWASTATDYVLDLRQRLPLQDESVAYIFTEHVLEHFHFEEGQEILQDFFRVLQPGGVVRIVVPDLELCCKAFLKGDKEWFGIVDAPAYSAGFGFNSIFYHHFHKYIHDFETLASLLQQAGFRHVVRSQFQESQYPDLRVDTDLVSRKLVSLYVDAQK